MNAKGRKTHERKCNAWNQANPVGCNVVVTLDSGEERSTTTKSEAYCAASGHAVIHLVGVSGYYILDRVRRRALGCATGESFPIPTSGQENP